jgi:hypothetical protein
MARAYEDDEISLPVADASHDLSQEDRMEPSAAGGAMGVFAGAAALGVVHLITPAVLTGPIHAAAAQWQVSPEISFTVAYVTVAAIGGLVGACFAAVTRYLRRWLPLVIWSLVFFVSVALLVCAFAKVPEHLAPPILAATAAYAFLMSFSLPMRKRSSSA